MNIIEQRLQKSSVWDPRMRNMSHVKDRGNTKSAPELQKRWLLGKSTSWLASMENYGDSSCILSYTINYISSMTRFYGVMVSTPDSESSIPLLISVLRTVLYVVESRESSFEITQFGWSRLKDKQQEEELRYLLNSQLVHESSLPVLEPQILRHLNERVWVFLRPSRCWRGVGCLSWP
jgi:hypothetical protein